MVFDFTSSAIPSRYQHLDEVEGTSAAVRWIAKIGYRLCREQRTLQGVERRGISGLTAPLPEDHADAGAGQVSHVTCGRLAILHDPVDPLPAG